MHYTVDECEIRKLNKALIGKVSIIRQGYFFVHVTPLGSNLAVLENLEEGEVEALVEGAADWLSRWFDEIQSWSLKKVDNKRLTWIRRYGVPVHAWSDKFLSWLIGGMGESTVLDENTAKRRTMDVARILLRVEVYDVVNSVTRVEINDELFEMKMVEDWYGPLQWVNPFPKLPSSYSSDKQSDGDSSAPFFEGYNQSGEDNLADIAMITPGSELKST